MQFLNSFADFAHNGLFHHVLCNFGLCILLQIVCGNIAKLELRVHLAKYKCCICHLSYDVTNQPLL